jgi:putative (di)nucleoside polyphosphate hydrolase
MDMVIEFKRDVYTRALQELSRFITRPAPAARRQPRDRATHKPLTMTDEASSMTESGSE